MDKLTIGITILLIIIGIRIAKTNLRPSPPKGRRPSPPVGTGGSAVRPPPVDPDGRRGKRRLIEDKKSLIDGKKTCIEQQESSMFYGKGWVRPTPDLSTWDTTQITNMRDWLRAAGDEVDITEHGDTYRRLLNTNTGVVRNGGRL